VRYATADEGVKEEEFDMVVLSVGLNPPKTMEGLAGPSASSSTITSSARPIPQPHGNHPAGVFVSGAFQGPTDIPESVFTASGAGSQCGQLLDYRRDKLAKDRVYPPEKDVTQEEPKIGVFVCHCGANIGSVVDVPSVVNTPSPCPTWCTPRNSFFPAPPTRPWKSPI
jgi:heterodisulfide reductase subunit A